MKLGQAYNLESFDKMRASRHAYGFADSAAGVTLSRNLTEVDPRIFEKRFPELTFVNSGIEFNNIGRDMRVIESLRLTPEGDFKDASDEADNKGKITLKGENNYIKVYEKEGFSEWSETEIRQAELNNVNLVSQFLSAHDKLYKQDIDKIGYLGHHENTGLLNNSYFSTSASADKYADMTPQQLYDVVGDAINTQWNTVSNTYEYRGNRFIMPIGMFNKIATQILNTAAGSFTVLKSLRDNFPEIEFGQTFRATDKAVIFSTHSEAMVMRIPNPLEVGEIIKKSSFKYEVESKYRVAGLDILEKDSGLIVTGLA